MLKSKFDFLLKILYFVICIPILIVIVILIEFDLMFGNA